MCMKYVNTNVQCFSSVATSILGHTGFSAIIESVKAEKNDEKYIIGGFNIVTFVNIRGTRGKNNTENNSLDRKDTLKFLIRLTKLDSDPEKQLSYDLKEFEIDLSDHKNLRHACFDYVERIEITEVDRLSLEEPGRYVIKILVKENSQKYYNVQMVHPIDVEV